MMRITPHDNKMYRHIRELEGAAAAVDAALDQVEALTDRIYGDFPSRQMQAFVEKKNLLMLECREMSRMLTFLKEEMEGTLRVIEEIDADIIRELSV